MLVIFVASAPSVRSGGLLMISASFMLNGCTRNEFTVLKPPVSAFAGSLAWTRQKMVPPGRSTAGVQDVVPPAPPEPSVTVALATIAPKPDDEDAWNKYEIGPTAPWREALLATNVGRRL